MKDVALSSESSQLKAKLALACVKVIAAELHQKALEKNFLLALFVKLCSDAILSKLAEAPEPLESAKTEELGGAAVKATPKKALDKIADSVSAPLEDTAPSNVQKIVKASAQILGKTIFVVGCAVALAGFISASVIFAMSALVKKTFDFIGGKSSKNNPERNFAQKIVGVVGSVIFGLGISVGVMLALVSIIPIAIASALKKGLNHLVGDKKNLHNSETPALTHKNEIQKSHQESLEKKEQAGNDLAIPAVRISTEVQAPLSTENVTTNKSSPPNLFSISEPFSKKKMLSSLNQEKKSNTFSASTKALYVGAVISACVATYFVFPLGLLLLIGIAGIYSAHKAQNDSAKTLASPAPAPASTLPFASLFSAQNTAVSPTPSL